MGAELTYPNLFHINRITGVYLRHDRQVIDDVAVQQNIATDTFWVRDRVKAFALKCALGFCHEIDPRSGIAIRFDLRGPWWIVFLAFFYRG